MKRGPVGENEFEQVTAVCLTVDPEIQQMTPRSSKDRNWQQALGIMTSIDRFLIGCFENNRSRQCDPPRYPRRGIRLEIVAEFGLEQSPEIVFDSHSISDRSCVFPRKTRGVLKQQFLTIVAFFLPILPDTYRDTATWTFRLDSPSGNRNEMDSY